MTAKPATDHNTPRSLDAIAGEIFHLDRRNVFAIGALLAEAREGAPGEHGMWKDWLAQFDFGYTTALNYLKAHDLALKCPTVGHLKVPTSILYRLADESSDDLPGIIKDLDKAARASEGPLSVVAAHEVVNDTKLRLKFGDYPGATLVALNESIPDDAEWAAGASDELKKARPTTEEEAEKIVLAHHRKHVEGLFGGALPDWLDERMLDWLEDDVQPEHREEVLAQLNDASQPLDWGQVVEITNDVRDDDEDQDDEPEEPEQDDDEPQSEQPKTEETSQAQAAAMQAARTDIGVDGTAERERLEAVVADLTSRNNAQKIALEGRDREIARLEDEIEKIRGDEPRLTVDKHVEALIRALKKTSRERAELVIEELREKLGLAKEMAR
jgi:hypothetical protein